MPRSTPTTTPRTDAECIQIYSDDVTGCSDARDYVDASFARTLETELADAKAEAAHYMSVAQKATDDLARLRAERADSASSVMWHLTAHQMACTAGLERDQLRAEVERLTFYIATTIQPEEYAKAIEDLRDELTAEREKVRLLREALADAADSGELTGCWLRQARAALAATERAK